MTTRLILGALLLAVATAAPAGPTLPGEALAPGAVHRNDSAEARYVLLELAPGQSFANTTDREFRVLSPRALTVVADEAVDPRLLAHEEALAGLRERLAGLEAALDEVAAVRDALREESP